ncbi:hypothetical protein ACTORR_01550 [Pseudomonas sp. SAR267]|uniref:hypothetical protein n=1 Tax=Pseudomonas sp. SAR267 TaxID=3454502 RepID=UPI003F8E223D
MPTENRSSNTQMVSVPRSDIEALLKEADHMSGYTTASNYEEVAGCIRHMRALLSQPTPQPHHEPIAWMVGTAFWWTKEEAERDAAAMGLPVVGLGPMISAVSAEQYQGEPAAIVAIGANDTAVIEFLSHDLKVGTELYAHADPGEVERLSQIIRDLNDERDEIGAEAGRLRTQLAEQRGLLKQADEFMYIMTGHDSHGRLAHKYGEKWWDAIDKLRGKVCTAISSAAAQVES